MGFAAFAAVLVLAGVLPEDPPAPLPQDPIVARGAGGLVLRRSALEGTLLERFGLSETGRDLLDLLVKSRLLDHLARERGIAVAEAEITQRMDELEKRARAAGEKGGLAGEIEKRGLSLAEFREFLRQHWQQRGRGE